MNVISNLVFLDALLREQLFIFLFRLSRIRWNKLCRSSQVVGGIITGRCTVSVLTCHRVAPGNGPLVLLSFLKYSDCVAKAAKLFFLALFSILLVLLQADTHVAGEALQDFHIFVGEASIISVQSRVLSGGISAVVGIPLFVERLKNGNHSALAIKNWNDGTIPIVLGINVSTRFLDAERIEIGFVDEISCNVPGSPRQYGPGDDSLSDRNHPCMVIGRERF